MENSKYTELSNSLVLSPVDDIRQAVLYVPAALYKDGKVQAAIGSRKAYTDFVRELKRLDSLAQKAARYDADDEDVTQAIDRLSFDNRRCLSQCSAVDTFIESTTHCKLRLMLTSS